LADEVGSQVTTLPESPSESPSAKIVSVVSPASGAGRTSAVVNVGWILASAGKRVLIVDLDGQPPAATEYLEPFHVEDVEVGDLIGDAAAGKFGWLVTEGWGLVGLTGRPGEDAALLVGRHQLPRGQVTLDMVRIPMREANQALVSAAVGQRLRAALVGLDYDYVLVDYPTVRADDRRMVSRLVLISDVVAVCFRPVPTEQPLARHLATDIRAAAAGRPEVVAVPTQVVGPLRAGPDQLREQVRAAFEGLPLVLVPYRSYQYPRSLAVLVDDPTDAGGPLAAYEQLVALLTGNEVDKLTPISPAVRARCMRAVGLEGDAASEQATVCYAPADRPWAEWLRAEFEQVGLDVTLASGPPPPGLPPASTVVVVQSGLLAGSAAGEWYAAHADPGRAQLPYEVVAVRVGTERIGAAAADVDVDLSGFSEKRARAELRSSLAMAASDRPITTVRWPGLGATVPRSNMLGSSEAFVGRAEDLQRLREGLLAAPLRLLTGEAGTGKSKLARRYGAQYGHDYDFVWWLAADDPVAVRARLSELGRALGAPDGGDPVTAAVDELARTHRPWLLIYHNATDPAAIVDLMPTGGRGHVVVTAPPGTWAGVQPRWPERWAEQQVGPLARAEAVELLRGYVAELTDSDAVTVLGETGTLPITLRLLGAYLAATVARFRQRAKSVATAVDLATTQFVHDYRGVTRGSAHADPTASCLALLRVSVVDETPHGRLALRLAQLCAFLPPDGIALRLLTSPGMLDQLAAAAGADGGVLAADPLELHQILHLATEYGLLTVDWGSGAAVQMHRLMQRLVRDAMSEQARAQRQAQLLRGLAGCAPTGAEADSAERLRRSRELAPYLGPAGALDSRDRQVRRWLVQHLRYLYQDGDSTTWRPAVELGERLLAKWASEPSEPPDGGDLRLQLAVQVANLHRALGDYAPARLWDEEILRVRQRAAETNLNHPRTLHAARGLAADLRALGRFRQASGYDQATWRGFLDAYGPDHPDTLMAANNVAVSAYLVGALETALAHWSELAEARRRLLGDDDPAVWNAFARVGLCLREMGRYEQGRQRLWEAQRHIERLRPLNHLDWLRIRHELSIAERLTGRHLEALNRQIDVLAKLRAALGEEHPETQAARLALAADHLAVGNVAEALALGQPALAWHGATFGTGHPFTLACEVDVAAFELAAGDAEAALERGTRAAHELAGRRGDDTALGRTHPWTLAAQLNRAGYLAAAGDLEAAAQLAEHTEVRCIDSLGTDHPHTHSAAATLAAIRSGQIRHSAGDSPGLCTIHLEIPRV